MNISRSRTILIVDDELSVREALHEALEMNDFKCMAVPSVKEAFKFLSKSEKPALILLDLMMPEMDGFDFLRERELIPDLVDIPVVIVSADGRVESKTANLKTDGYLKKPLSLSKLLETAEKYCR